MKSRVASARSKVRDEKVRLQAETAELEAAEEALALVRAAAQATQKDAHRHLTGVVTECLAAVFGDDAYTFRAAFEERAGGTQTRLYFERDGREFDPLTETGGGVVDVAAFALRLACLCLTVPRSRLVLLLDEPFRHLSKEYRPRAAELLQTLSDRLNVQIIQVTHDPALEIGTVIRLGE